MHDLRNWTIAVVHLFCIVSFTSPDIFKASKPKFGVTNCNTFFSFTTRKSFTQLTIQCIVYTYTYCLRCPLMLLIIDTLGVQSKWMAPLQVLQPERCFLDWVIDWSRSPWVCVCVRGIGGIGVNDRSSIEGHNRPCQTL